ncbi:hypothetical protein GCM10010260_58630 [Streptomyces filipinensis]|uniref:Uncharacterized protein n=1 Tax=Streptomyces filipinensis TaxID=66887 RepID=A0A918IFV1_9ACTN|nr:hypothetical protein GCM10010260_58630 [Streptomyces filipinensis]
MARGTDIASGRGGLRLWRWVLRGGGGSTDVICRVGLPRRDHPRTRGEHAASAGRPAVPAGLLFVPYTGMTW